MKCYTKSILLLLPIKQLQMHMLNEVFYSITNSIEFLFKYSTTILFLVATDINTKVLSSMMRYMVITNVCHFFMFHHDVIGEQ